MLHIIKREPEKRLKYISFLQPDDEYNAISKANTPVMDSLKKVRITSPAFLACCLSQPLFWLENSQTSLHMLEDKGPLRTCNSV